jgi:hypothetical protein
VAARSEIIARRIKSWGKDLGVIDASLLLRLNSRTNGNH